MNKKIIVLLASIFIASAFAFAACSNTEENNEESSGPLTITTLNSGKVVVDSETDLTWANHESDACLGIELPSEITDSPAESIAYCDTLDYAGSTNWRLPTEDELVDFVQKTESQGLELDYQFPNCQTVVAQNGRFVKTENTDEAGAAYDTVSTAVGTRCVTDDDLQASSGYTY